MQTRQLLIFIALSLIAAATVVWAVTTFRSPTTATVTTPVVHGDTDKPGGGTTVDAPNVHIEKDKDGTKVEAPGVKIEVPKSPQ